jgi:hypothetical protein
LRNFAAPATIWRPADYNSAIQQIANLRPSTPLRSVTLADQTLGSVHYSSADKLLWIRISNEARPRELAIEF